MSIFGQLMRGNVTITRRTGTNTNGVATYAAAETIAGRVAYERHEIIDAKGQRTSSDATLYTPVVVATGDLITGGGLTNMPIKAVYARLAVLGATDHWEARL